MPLFGWGRTHRLRRVFSCIFAAFELRASRRDSERLYCSQSSLWFRLPAVTRSPSWLAMPHKSRSKWRLEHRRRSRCVNQAGAAGSVELQIGGPVTAKGCYASLLRVSGRPTVLQVASYRDPSGETFPSFFLRALAERSGSRPHWLGRAIPAEAYVSRRRPMARSGTPPIDQPAQIVIRSLAADGFRGRSARQCLRQQRQRREPGRNRQTERIAVPNLSPQIAELFRTVPIRPHVRGPAVSRRG